MAPYKTRVAEEVEKAFEKALKQGILQPAPLGWEGAKSLLIKSIASRRNSTIIIDEIDKFLVFKKLLNELKAVYDAVKPGELRLLLASQTVVPLLLGSGVCPQTGGHLEQTMQLAAFQGKTAIVRELFRKGFNSDQADEVLGTPLQAAIAGGRRELVNILLDDYSADVDASGVSFGNALQMALAMQDQELVASLRAHGAGHKETTRRDRIWDNAWRTARGARFNADETINMLRNTFLMTPELPDGVDRRLKLLAICIHHRREIIRHQKLAGYSEHVWRSKEPLRVKIDKEGTWQQVVERFRDAEVATLGFIPTTCTWLLVAHCQLGVNRNNLSRARKVIKQGETIYKILSRHETFIRTLPEIGPTLELEEFLGNLFGHIISLVSDVAENLSALSTDAPYNRIVNRRLASKGGTMALESNKMRELQNLHKDAMIAEDNARSMATLNQVISEYDARTTSELKQIRREITELRANIGDLTHKTDLLLGLLKSLQS
ncbi:ankyrin repeat domain-containing protein [Fusarium mexicanum]|uniref:Ankyrin repeat domain-containing protein n=1 Tax=Fusarium mexicanum TaxID=751941 RepID=A0A8H5ISY3_9HYPO|nr:ankyrin repeat domain-containing protein [Fusarium mexicanum]